MIKIDLGKDLEFEVELGGKTYTLREPSVEEVDELKDAPANDGIKTVTKFLMSIGMPEQVIKSMGFSKAKRLMDALMGEFSKKK